MQIRRVLTHELKQAALLAEDVFCADGDRYMESSFPALFQTGISHSYGAFTPEGVLVSFMGMVPVQIQSGTYTVSAYSIGAVCTHPDYRGQGLAGQLLELCRQHARSAGASVLFISGDRSLYTRVGSVPFGQISVFELSTASFSTLPDASLHLSYRDLLPQDIFAVAHHIQAQYAHIRWGLGDLQQFIAAHPMANINKQQQHIRVAETADHQVAGFVILSIPHEEDTATSRIGSVIEYGGDPEVVYPLFVDAITHYQLSSLTVRIPWQDKSLIDLFLKANIPVSIEKNGGTLLVLDHDLLLEQTGVHDFLNAHDIKVQLDNGYALHTPSASYPFNSAQEWYDLLFDPAATLTHKMNLAFPTVPLPYLYGLYFI